MLKKVVKNFLIFLAGFTVIASFAWAQESSPSTEVEELIVQIQALRAEISQLKEMVDQAREIAVDSRLEAEKFKEETLYRLGLWRTRLGEGMMMSLSAKKASERAEEAAKSASEQIELVLKRMKGVEERFGILSKKVEEEISARIKLEEKSTELERKLALLSQDVESLKTDVALAKEMAATAKAQADQAVKDLEEKMNRKLALLSQDVESLKTDVALAKEMAATAKAQADQAVKDLEKKMNRKLALLSQDVESLKTDVALAKEMAATAKAQADQAQLDVQRLSGEVRKNRELFLSSIEKILEQIKEKEKKFKAEKVELKAPPSAMIYRVKKGDSLWSIAGSPEVYNDPNKWKKIFEANKDRLTSPDLLYPGQKLIIPRE